MDFTTRWNSNLDLLEQYLNLQPAVAAALLSPEVCHNACEIDTLDNLDIMKLLNPLKTVTTMLTDEQNPTMSLNAPLKDTIEQSVLPVEEDSTMVSMMRKAIFNNLSDRYTGPGDNHLLECTALDPRFCSLPHLTKDQCQDVFQRVKEKAVQMHNQVLILLSVTNSSTSVAFTLRPGLFFILTFILIFVLVVVSFFLCFFLVSFPFLLLFLFFPF